MSSARAPNPFISADDQIDCHIDPNLSSTFAGACLLASTIYQCTTSARHDEAAQREIISPTHRKERVAASSWRYDPVPLGARCQPPPVPRLFGPVPGPFPGPFSEHACSRVRNSSQLSADGRRHGDGKTAHTKQQQRRSEQFNVTIWCPLQARLRLRCRGSAGVCAYLVQRRCDKQQPAAAEAGAALRACENGGCPQNYPGNRSPHP